VIAKRSSALSNPLTVRLLAQRLRQTLLRGYEPEGTFAVVVASLSDEDLVARYVDRTESRPPQPQRKITRVTWR
jgi:hypothetical protein